MKASELKTGDKIQFFALPYGSYASVLEPYRVERNDSKFIRLVHISTGSSTIDSVASFRGASFELLAA